MSMISRGSLSSGEVSPDSPLFHACESLVHALSELLDNGADLAHSVNVLPCEWTVF
jgi:hypothetical protein